MGRCLGKIIASAHAFDSTLSIYDSLLAGVEGMTLATDLNTYGGLGPTCIKHVAARASYSRFNEFRVNICFHCNYRLIKRTLWDRR